MLGSIDYIFILLFIIVQHNKDTKFQIIMHCE